MLTVENKRQVLTIAVAMGLGAVAVFLAVHILNQEMEKRNETLAAQLKQEYQQKLDENKQIMARDMSMMRKEITSQMQQIAEQQMKMAERNSSSTGTTPPVSVGSFALTTPSGKRAITVQIDALSAVGGLLSAGDFVDVLAQLDVPEYESKPDSKKVVTTLLFQNVKVLAVGTDYQAAAATDVKYQNQQKSKDLYVTIALSPEEAGLMAFAQGHGKFQFVLRSPKSREVAPAQVASWKTLSEYLKDQQGIELVMPEKKPAQDVIDPPKQPAIQVLRAGQ